MQHTSMALSENDAVSLRQRLELQPCLRLDRLASQKNAQVSTAKHQLAFVHLFPPDKLRVSL